MNLHILHTLKGILSDDVAQLLRNRDPLLINDESNLGNSRLDLTVAFISIFCGFFVSKGKLLHFYFTSLQGVLSAVWQP